MKTKKIKVLDMIFGKKYSIIHDDEVITGIFDEYWENAPVIHFGNGGFYSLVGQKYINIVEE
ncbi:MAG: hypothetical protein ACLT40_00450 [Fusobacterium sp.]